MVFGTLHGLVISVVDQPFGSLVVIVERVLRTHRNRLDGELGQRQASDAATRTAESPGDDIVAEADAFEDLGAVVAATIK